MKLTNLLNVLVVTSSAAALLGTTNVVESWDIQDLRDYLNDNKIPYDEKKATVDELKDLSIKQWQLHRSQQESGRPSWFSTENLKQKVLGGWGSSGSGTVRSKTPETDYNNLKDWVFSTWSAADLHKLLKEAGVKHDYDGAASRSSLEKLAQDNYDAIAQHFKASGKYPGNWLYSTWDTKDLKKWLKQYGVDYSTLRDSKDDLVTKVRENSYKASQYVADERDNVLESLDLSSQSLFDKAGAIKEDVFQSWSTLQLSDWLKTHGIELEESVKSSQKELAAVAAKHAAELKADIDYWVSKASQRASPLLEKGSKKADEVINDTFLVGVEGWSKARLRAFLNARDVSVPFLSTKHNLVELVKANKYKPVKHFNSDALFEGWSRENVQKWLEEQGASANDAYKSFADSLAGYAQAAQAKVQDATGYGKPKSTKEALFDKWSNAELQKYLRTFGIRPQRATKREELLEMAKQNTLWFVTGETSTGGVAARTKLTAANACNSVVYYWRSLVNYVRYMLNL